MPDVLVLTPDFPPEIGGIQTLAHRLISAFTRYRPRVVAPSSAGSSDFDRGLPFPVTRSRPTRQRHEVEIIALNLTGLLEAVRRAPAAIMSVHVVTAPGALVAGRLLGRPVILFAHGQELGNRPRLARYVLPRSAGVVAVSRHTRRLVEQLGVDPHRVRIVHPGVDQPDAAVPERTGSKTVIVVSRLEDRYKGHDVLLRSMVAVRRRAPSARLHVVGDGVLRPELERLADRLGIAEATVFHGTVTQAERDDLLRASAVFAMPSRIERQGAGEGFGIAYVEAGACGLPVVAGRVAGALDAVVDGETGLLVDPEDADAVADAIATLLLDSDAARRMGRAGWERAKELSWSRAAAEVESLLDEVVAA